MIRRTLKHETAGTHEVQLYSARTAIETLKPPVSEAAVEHVRAAIDRDAAMAADALRQSSWVALKTAEAAAGTAATAAANAKTAAGAAAARAAEHPRGSLPIAIVNGAAATACFMSEFALSVDIFPYLLGAPKMSMLGIALGAAPPTALLVLEIVIERLVEHPWHALRHGVAS